MNRRCEYIENTSAKEDLRFPVEPSDKDGVGRHVLGYEWCVVVDQFTGIAYAGQAFHKDDFLRNHVEAFITSDPPTPRELRQLRNCSKQL